jgi:hypothetical protein
MINTSARKQYALACAVSAIMGIGGRLLCASYARINSVASIPPMKGIDTSICPIRMTSTYSRQTGSHAYEDDIKGPIPLHTGSEGVHRKRPILCNLDCVPVLFEDFDGQLLVHQVVLGK